MSVLGRQRPFCSCFRSTDRLSESSGSRRPLPCPGFTRKTSSSSDASVIRRRPPIISAYRTFPISAKLSSLPCWPHFFWLQLIFLEIPTFCYFRIQSRKAVPYVDFLAKAILALCQRKRLIDCAFKRWMVVLVCASPPYFVAIILRGE